MDKIIEKYISYVPNKQQKCAQRKGFNAFIHYGLNTFTGIEWGSGKVSPTVFNPTAQNTDSWCEALKDAGVYCVIFTAKHHDGFCLWRTATTSYNISQSPYKGGNGDVVREVSDSAGKYGLKFGIYLSPWDRNNENYGTNSDKYNDIYIEQLTELLTGYGEISYVWLDGACGSYMDGKPKQTYDFPRYYAKVRELAPNACISNCGPDIRWVGNEGGFSRESEWNVVPKFSADIQTIEKNSQQADDGKFAKKGADIISSDLGSREFLSEFDDFMWYPAEVDVSIRPGWFYHSSQDHSVRSLNNLMNIYYNSVGGNTLLLLNVPPDKRGLFHENDVKRLRELGAATRSAFAKQVKIVKITAPKGEKLHPIEGVLSSEIDENMEPLEYYTPETEDSGYTLALTFDKPHNIDKLKLIENTSFSQRVESFTIYAQIGGADKVVYRGTTIGYMRIALFKKAVLANGVKIVIESCRSKPYIEHISVYETDGYIPRKSTFKKLKVKVHQIIYKIFVARENKNNK